MGEAKFTGRTCARAAVQRKRRRTCGCWVRQLILRQRVILFWLYTRDQTKIWTLPAPSSFTFSHSSRGTYTHLFHPFVYLAPAPLCCTCEELDGKTGNRDEKKISGGGVWEDRDDRKKWTSPSLDFCDLWSGNTVPEPTFRLLLNVHLICIHTCKRLFSSIFWQY